MWAPLRKIPAIGSSTTPLIFKPPPWDKHNTQTNNYYYRNNNACMYISLGIFSKLQTILHYYNYIMNMLFQLTPWPINIYPQTLILYLFTRIAYMYNHQHMLVCC